MRERFFHQVFAETGNYNVIGSYWEKCNLNEIDLVAINDLKKEITLADIKLDRKKLNLNALKESAQGLFINIPATKLNGWD